MWIKINNGAYTRFATYKKILFGKEQNSENVFLVILDNGKGIISKNVSSVFNEEYSTKKGVGHGLGLSHSKYFIEQNDSEINIESKIGKWTKVIIKFPNIKKKKI